MFSSSGCAGKKRLRRDCALILALADYRGEGLPAADRESLERELLSSFRADPDPGIHSAAELLLRRWGQGDQVDAIAEDLKGASPSAGRRWYVSPLGHTMVVIDPRGDDVGLSCGRPIDRVFEMAAKEVSVKQFLQFRAEPRVLARAQSSAGLPDQRGDLVRRRGLLSLAQRTRGSTGA